MPIADDFDRVGAQAPGAASCEPFSAAAKVAERFLRAGAETLSDREMLELVLGLEGGRDGVARTAGALIERFGGFAETISAEPARLREVADVEDGAVLALKAVQAAALRLARAEVAARPVLSSSEKLHDYLAASMAYAKTEQVRILFLDAKNMMIADEVQHQGTVDRTALYPREVMKRALELGASALILVHNHPSGDPTPTGDDIDMTEELVEAGRFIGVVVHDHLVIARGRHASFKALGLL